MFLINESVSVTREKKKRTEGLLTNLSVINCYLLFLFFCDIGTAKGNGINCHYFKMVN